ncbi:hypothetical protein GTV15_20665 [Streptomyces sp. SID7803]|nr:hypothetical protein [Streptomyces sp. SID7803]
MVGRRRKNASSPGSTLTSCRRSRWIKRLRERWNRRLLTLVEDFPPEAADDLAAMARRKPEEQQSGVSQSAENNTGSVIQIGRDNSGSLNTERR